MPPTGTRALSARQLLDANRLYYDSLWSGAQLVEPARFNTWPLIQTLLPRGGRCLEVAPGLRPRLPLEGTQFVDVSGPALAKLARRGASVAGALITSLPFAEFVAPPGVGALFTSPLLPTLAKFAAVVAALSKLSAIDALILPPGVSCAQIFCTSLVPGTRT